MNNSQTIFAALRDVLADLYPEESSTRVVVADAGLNARQIAFSPRAQTNWHNILAEAIRQNRLDGLLKVVRTAYGGNSALTDAYAEYWDFIDQGGHLETPAQLPAIGPLFSETDLQDQNNRRVLRQMVRKFWIEDVLEHSLNHEAALRLHLSDRSNLVTNRPWKLLPQQVGETVRLLPTETHILDVFDQMNERLLILGEPGAGKTTLLLELARALLQRADTTPGYPSLVVFNLSSWIERKAPLAEWMIDELLRRHNIPKKLAQAWVTQDKLLPLLDGLDEVQPEHRHACAEAINQFHAKHFVPLVVCSRVTEYENLTVRLKLQGAVLLQPLTPAQIDAYLNRAGSTLATVRNALQHDTELQELAQSPLMLNIMALAYQGAAPAELNLTDATQTRRQHLFNTYIQRMFVRREIAPIYSTHQTIHWLQWLATRLAQSGQTIFLIERMQPGWICASNQMAFTSLIMLAWSLLYGGGSGLIIWLIFKLNGMSIIGLRSGLGLGLMVGLTAGLIDRLSGRFREIQPFEQSRVAWKRLRSGLYAIFFWGIMGGLAGGLSGGLVGAFREIELIKWSGWSRNKLRKSLPAGLIFGLYVGLIHALIDWLFFDPFGRSGLVVHLMVKGIYGLIGGLLFGLLVEPSSRIADIRQVMTQVPNQGIWLSTRYALATGLSFLVIGALIVGLLGKVRQIPLDMVNMILSFYLGSIFGLLGGLLGGGDAVMKHFLLRFILWLQRHTPWNYARFLDYATALIFLRKVGGGYIFVHRLVMEHFAGLDEQTIERITTSLDGK